MTQKELNERIAMSLLTQCAWMWEHCTISAIEGEFRLSDIYQGLYSRKRGDAKTGYASIDMGMCQCWEHFADGIDGLTRFDCVPGDATLKEVALEFEGFHCSYLLKDVLGITRSWCSVNGCSALANKAVFGYKDGERYCRLPDGKVFTKSAPKRETRPKVKSAQKPTKKAEKREAKVVVKQIAQPKQTKDATTPLSLADRLREALRARLAA